MSRALILLVLFGAACSSKKDKPAPKSRVADTSGHGNGIDEASSAQLAMLEAPEGATPCETAINAIEAEQKAALAAHHPSIFAWVAPRADFLALCQTLPEETQKCLTPKYMAKNRPSCQSARPASDTMDKLLKADASAVKVLVDQ